jgi:hypothetical protein
MNSPLLVVLEGANDIEFLKRLTRTLRRQFPELPDLHSWEAEGRIVLIPVGGGDASSWPDRLRGLGLPEFHLYDREQLPETDARRRAINRINARSECYGALTSKRSLENYLHPRAIAAAGGHSPDFGDEDSVSHLITRQRYELASIPWQELPSSKQRRLTARTKRWLNRVAVEHMTADLLAERDPRGEVLGWLGTIAELAGSQGSCVSQSAAS